jgi:hypothetical protein
VLRFRFESSVEVGDRVCRSDLVEEPVKRICVIQSQAPKWISEMIDDQPGVLKQGSESGLRVYITDKEGFQSRNGVELCSEAALS